ncbi:cyclopropane-fatty-acyl-phospholipid synthase family protein [Phenylobacterium sp.]|uniref:SAM-dependent methyltransferase n=1 Tax=Phenylobacterium sp. TaxID=1871053 RepID=UPI0035B3C1C9
MDNERSVAAHYAHGALEEAILGGLQAAGKDLAHLVPADLSPVDEFHMGGRQATEDVAAQLDLKPGMRLIDIGCGLGGASRYFAETHGCQVSGVDLTEEYVATARALAALVGLQGKVSYEQASALALPFDDAAFDGGYMFHVGMNIADKPALFAEIRRVLKPGAVFAVYDVMAEPGEGEVAYPVAWASSPATSFLADAAGYRRALENAGFAVDATRSRRAFALEFFKAMRARMAANGPPPLGLHIVMGADAGVKSANMAANLERGVIAPTEIFARAV